MAQYTRDNCHGILLNHVSLPPKLPQEEDYDAELDGTLTRFVVSSLVSFRGFYAMVSVERASIDSAIAMLSTMQQVHITTGAAAVGGINEQKLQSALCELTVNGGNLLLHISAQNAGIIIRKANNTAVFELLELAPRNNAVYFGSGRLRRCFPRCAITVDATGFDQPGFQGTLAYMLAKMSH
ncbi:hypothetical protein LTR62_000904 [Meristemomyces frigidus]|uniref:DUF6606 domain-containing protein n=1 Tax=Meristemomyces frigidus TaxID=1508187 RepID=A0AAN7T8V5_9PEZI|nr:hypothetical protein LTR62_000904 [Meristemomyces frigidus]